jgi:asparagine synthase (glutamine-hydrolysing)
LAQYFLHLESEGSASLGAVSRQALAALSKLQPELRTSPIVSQTLAGWVAPVDTRDETRAYARSADGQFDVIVAGTWFARGVTATSAEALAAWISREGVDAIASALEGPFAIAVHDRFRGLLHVVTDIAGTMHVFCVRNDSGWMISTSSAWLAAMGRTDLDPIGLHEFIATGIVFEDRTLWRGVHKIGPARITTFAADGKTSSRQYWSFAGLQPERDDLDTSVQRLSASLANAARLIGARYPRVLCDITGGYDSRATIAGFMLAGVPFAGTVSGAETSPDVVISHAIAERFAIPHRRAVPSLRYDRTELERSTALTDGEYDAVEYARIAAIHREHATGHDISVNGSFGELARGYWWELLWPAIGRRKVLDCEMLSRRRFAAFPYDATVFADGARFDLTRHMTSVIARVNDPVRDMPNTTQMDHSYFALRMQRWQGRIASSTSRIFPGLSPFAFRSVLEATLEARASSRIRSLLIRTVLARHAPTLARIPLEGGYPAVPATASKLHLFWPLIPHYAERVRSKLARMGPPRVTRPAPSAAFGFPEAEDAFAPLFALPMFAPDPLRQFIDAGRHGAQRARLLTVALGVRLVSEARNAAAAGERDMAAVPYGSTLEVPSAAAAVPVSA